MKKKFLKNISLFLIAQVILLGLFVSNFISFAQAKDAFSLEVYPPVSYLTIKPGAGITKEINLKNDGQYSLEVTAQLVDFHSDQLTGQAILEQSSDFPYLTIEGESSNWGKSFFLKPGQSQNINLVIAVPSDFPVGEQHLSVLFQAKQMLGADNAANTLISGIVASNVILLVSNEEENRAELQVEDFNIPHFVDSFLGIDFSILFKNTGLNAAPISGQVKIKHWPDENPKVYQLYPDMVLAGSSRLARGMTEDELKELEDLEKNKAVIEAANQNFQEQKNKAIQEKLKSKFYYKRAFLLGVYDFELEFAGKVIKKRVIALPLSLLILVFFLPILYWLLNKLQRQAQIGKNTSYSDKDTESSKKEKR